MQHATAKVSWSQHPDGMAHITGRLSTIEKCWAKGTGEMANPADIGMHQDARGVWRQPADHRVGDGYASGYAEQHVGWGDFL